MSGLLRLKRTTRLIFHAINGLITAARNRQHVVNGIPDEHFMMLHQRWMDKLTHILPLDIHYHGTPTQETALWISNHVSWMDIPVIGSLAKVGFLSKAEVADWPLVGGLAKRSGTLFIERGNANAARDALENMGYHVQQGHSILFFPEGTTSDGRGLKPFRHRLFPVALSTGCPIQPVLLQYRDEAGQPSDVAPFIGDDTFVRNFWQIMATRSIRVDVTFLAPFQAQDASPRELASELHKQVASELKRLTS